MALPSQTELSPMRMTPEAMLRVPLGAASPLWALIGGAAMSGVAWWWMTRWGRRENLEAMFGARAAAKTVERVEESLPPEPVGGEAAPVSPVLAAEPEPEPTPAAVTKPPPASEAPKAEVPEPPKAAAPKPTAPSAAEPHPAPIAKPQPSAAVAKAPTAEVEPRSLKPRSEPKPN